MTATHDLLTPTMIAREALMLLKNNLVMGSNVYRAYETEFPGSPKKGGSVQIRKPVKFQVTKSRVRVSSSISENYVTLTISTQAHVSWDFYAVDLTLTIEQYSERYLRSAAAQLANTIDNDLCGLYTDVYNMVWDSTGFVTPSTFMCLGQAMQRLDEEAAPPNDRTVVFNPAAHWGLANALHSLNPGSIAEPALRKGFLGRIANADVFMDQNIKVHLTGLSWASTHTMVFGSTAGTPETASAPHTSIQILRLGVVSTSAALLTGDVITIAGVYAVNPMSGESTGSLRMFVVTADVGCTNTGSGSANFVTVNIEPGMVATGPYKNVDTYPAPGAAIGNLHHAGHYYPQNLAFHKNAFALCMVPLAVPDGVSFSSSITEDGYSIRIVKDYDIDQDSEIVRLDVLYGIKTIYPELAVRIYGQEQT